MTADTINATLSNWLRLLWDMAPPLRLDSESPYIAGGAIHLPARTHWRHHSASAAHAAAHLVYSPTAFDGDGLGAIPRALVALLEDARVESLAVRELPGLARLWRPLHTATPELGNGFEALMERLARSLADTSYDDPHRWVRKGRALFYLDAGLGLLALRTAAEVRQAATRLGHDIGQMRLQFNSRDYRPLPAYRDDHRWMWSADMPEAVTPPPTPSDDAGPGSSDAAEEDDEPSEHDAVAWYPEWDRLISRLRPDWCRVVEQPLPTVQAAPVDEAWRQLGRRLRRPIRELSRHAGATQRSDDGEVFDLSALVDSRVASLLHLPIDTRVYRTHQRKGARAAVCLLIDQSASTADLHGTHGTVLQMAVRSAAATLQALQACDVDCAASGFSSSGRLAVRMRTVKPFSGSSRREPGGAAGISASGTTWARLAMLRPGGSTRLGAAIRHAARRFVAHGSGPRLIVVLSDGEPHDIDIHDPRYLVEDARQAVREAARRGVRVVCFVLAAEAGDDALRVFGIRGLHTVRDGNDLPRAVKRLLR